MEPGLKRTTIARIAAALGCLSGAIGLLAAITNQPLWLAPHGSGIGAILLLLIALFVLVDGMVSFAKSQLGTAPKQEARGLTIQFLVSDIISVRRRCEELFHFVHAQRCF
jgi:uncharacterized protein (DUF58 family)